VARIGFRAVSRVLRLLAGALGIKQAPCPHTVINGVTRLAMGRTQSARLREGLPLRQAPLSNGRIWLIDSRIGLGTGKMWAVLAVDAHHPQLVPSARSLARVHWIGVSVAEAWTGDARADLLDRLIAQMGRPAAYLKDGGSDRPKAVATLDEQGLGSPGIADISPAVAGLRKRTSPAHPAWATFLTACGQVSDTLTHTILAWLAPPKVRPTARFMPVHRLGTWADQGLTLAPAGGAKQGSA
jgi:hypothetical protein